MARTTSAAKTPRKSAARKAASRPRAPSKVSSKAKAGRAGAQPPAPDPDGVAEPLSLPQPKIGRPTDYKPEFAAIAKAMCRMGATDQEVADELGVDTTTIWRWRSKHEEFCKAMKVGKEIADDRVERSLFQRAVGYSFKAVKVMQHNGVAMRADYVEHVPPDVAAAKHWLNNRRPKDWREKTDLDLPAGGITVQIVRYAGSAIGKPPAARLIEAEET
jgi:hypothetical protein